MSDINSTYVNAFLADAAYVSLPRGVIPDDLLKEGQELPKRMPPTLAQYIADNFEVASAIDTPDAVGAGSGFDATVWRGRAGTLFAGQVFVSMRGTEPDAGGADVSADADLTLGVAARDQIIDMANWWLRESTAQGATAKQLKLTKKDVIVPGPTGPTVVTEYKVEAADSALGTGHLKDVTNVQVNGHSLGGHLASSFALIFGGATQEKGSVAVGGVSTFNSAGFIRSSEVESFFAEIQGFLHTGLPSLDQVQPIQTNFYAENGITVATNETWFRQMGHRVGLNQEQSPASSTWDNHRIYKLTDLLALGAAMEKLDSGMSIDKLNALMPLGSNQPAASIEGLFDALRRAVEGPGIIASHISDAGDSDPARVDYHAALAKFNDDHSSLAGKLSISAAGPDLGAQARSDFAAFVALKDLSPIVVHGAPESLWQGTRGADYAAWQADQAKPDAQRTFTDQYLADRTAMLAVLLRRNQEDDQNPILSGPQDLRYFDQASNTSLRTGSSLADDANRRQYIFDDSQGRPLFGGNKDDHLYGGAGDDTLEGKGGDDYLEGGAGNDTYVLSLGDSGVDTIVDSDGQGQIKINGSAIAASFSPLASAIQAGVYYSSDYGYKLSRIGGGSTRGDWSLYARTAGGGYHEVARLKNWQSGELGLDTNGAPLGESAPTTGPGSYSNSVAYMNFNASNAGVGVFMQSGSKSSSFTGSAHNDRIITGDGLGNYVMAQGGNDIVIGGSGREYIRAGSNLAGVTNDNDSVQAGGGTDMVYGGSGDDSLWGNTEDTEYLQEQADSGDRGDWLSGEGGDDHIYGSHSRDVIFGGAGNDEVAGGAGDDLILGDAMYSVSSRAMGLPYAPAGTQSFVWNADGSIRGPLGEYDYGLDPVMVPNGSIYNWEWSGTETDYSLTLASGVTFLSQTRVAPDGGNDILDGGAGNDWIAGQTGDDTLYGGSGDDVLYGDDAVPLPAGSWEGDDTLYAGAGRDVLYGGGGDDVLNAQDDDNDLDRLYGGDGDDVLSGGTGHDELHGDAGNDTLFAGSDGSVMEGGQGNDLYVGGAGDDTMRDVSGDDTYHTSGGSDTIMDQGGDDSYYINLASLQAGGTTTLTDADGVGRLFFDGAILAASRVRAVSDGQWQSTDGSGLLTRQGGDLVIASTDAAITGKVVVKNFFSQDTFLGLQLPAYQPPAPVNRAPVAGSAIGAQSVDEDSAWSLTMAADAFSDPDGDALTYSAQLADGNPLPGWLAFDPATRTFSGTPDNGAVGTLQLAVTASDGHGGSASQSFALTVVNTNDAPQAGVALAEQTGQEKQAFSYTLPGDAFTDVDVGDVLAFSASGLPAWLKFDAGSATFSGTPPAGTAGTVDVTVTATDLAGATAQQTLSIRVEPQPGNHAPVVGVPIGGQSTREWDAWTYGLPPGAFTDADVGDRLSYSATLDDGAPLPYWLKLDAATGTFSSAQVPQGYAGTLNLRVTATDLAGASASQTFALAVAANKQLNMVSGTPGADFKFGSKGNDLLIGGKGNDVLTGGLGNDTYRWSKGDGNDRLIELGGNDTIEFTDVNPDEVSIGKTWWGDMQITVKSTGETITVTLGLSSLTSAGWIEQIRFADGTVWDHAQMARRSTLVKSADVAPLAAQPLLDQPPLWQAVSTSGDVNQLVQAMAAFSPETAASGMAGASPLLDRPAQRNALLTSEFA